MNPIENIEISCPYCGEVLEILVDCTAGKQKYIEDCHICCRPISITIKIGQDGMPEVDTEKEDDI